MKQKRLLDSAIPQSALYYRNSRPAGRSAEGSQTGVFNTRIAEGSQTGTFCTRIGHWLIWGLTLMAVTGAIGAKADDLSGILAPGAAVEQVATGFKFIEGPVWMPRGFLVFSDIPNNSLVKWQQGQNPEIFRKPSGNANGNTLDKQGRLLSCQHDRQVTRRERDGKITVLADRYEGKRLNSPNDLVVAADNSIYFTDPPYGLPDAKAAELDFNGVYRLAPNGKLTLLVKDFVRPNGIAFSPDETKLYVNDTEKGHIRVFNVQKDGTLTNDRVFAELKEPGKAGAPDGMKVDQKGNVYCTGPGAVWVFTPDGKLLGKIATPEVPANCGFGDRDFKTLYITAGTSLYRIRLQNAGIRPGPPPRR